MNYQTNPQSTLQIHLHYDSLLSNYDSVILCTSLTHAFIYHSQRTLLVHLWYGQQKHFFVQK